MSDNTDDEEKKIPAWKQAVAAGAISAAFVGAAAWNTFRNVERPDNQNTQNVVDSNVGWAKEPTMESLIERAARGSLHNEARAYIEDYFNFYRTDNAGLSDVLCVFDTGDYAAASMAWHQFRHTHTMRERVEFIPPQKEGLPDEVYTAPVVERAQMLSITGRMISALYQNAVREQIRQNPDAMFDGMTDRLIRMDHSLAPMIAGLKEELSQQQQELESLRTQSPDFLDHMQGRVSQTRERLVMFEHIQEQGGVKAAVEEVIAAYKCGDASQAAKFSGAITILYQQQPATSEEQAPSAPGEAFSEAAAEHFTFSERLGAINAYMKSLARKQPTIGR